MFKKIFKYFINPAVKCREVKKELLNISEPVLSMVQTLSEKGRWKFKAEFDILSTISHRGSTYKWTLFDKKTGEEFKFLSSGYRFFVPSSKSMILIPIDIQRSSLPYWLTEDELEYIESVSIKHLKSLNDRLELISAHVEKKRADITKRNGNIERERLISIYK